MKQYKRSKNKINKNKVFGNKISGIAVCMFMCLIASACGKNSVPEENTAFTEDSIDADTQEADANAAANADKETSDNGNSDKESSDADITEGADTDEQAVIEENQTPARRIEVVPANKVSIYKREDEGGRRITVEEMQYFTEFVQTGHNYGFLLSVYDTPADVNLFEVCYNGLGISSVSDISEEEREAFKKTVPWGEIETDFFRITTAQLNEFLLEKTGLSYERMNDTLDWTYLPEYDAYYSDHGDTNYEKFYCVGGYVVDEKFYILRMSRGTIDFSEYDYDELDEYLNSYRGSNYELDYELVLEKCGDTYQFRSNRLILENRLIEKQSFTVNLSPIGEVTLVSYEPDEEEKDRYKDVTFHLIKDGMELQHLGGTGTPRYETKDTFNKIEAIAFADYDEDGITDIIMILDYDYVSGPNAAETHSEVRIYKGEYIEYSYGGYFYKQRYQEDLSKTLTSEFSEPTIREVLDYLAKIS